jgi:hypothetical protein
MMTSTTGGDNHNVVQFPKSAEERRAHRKAKEALEKQRLINVFIDEVGGDKALFHTRDDIAYADLIIAGHRETWQVRSKQFRHAYLRYLQRQFDRLVGEDEPLMAVALKAAMNKLRSTTLSMILSDALSVQQQLVMCMCVSPDLLASSISIFATMIGRVSALQLEAGPSSTLRRYGLSAPMACCLSQFPSAAARLKPCGRF